MSPRAFAADAAEWFEVREIEPGVHIVAEPGHVFSWLVSGSERCALLDTGLGLADISAAIEPVASGPPFVVNSHVHFDHVGGNELFETSRCMRSARSGSSGGRRSGSFAPTTSSPARWTRRGGGSWKPTARSGS